jgi:addiction module HigA family antidote
MARPLPKRITTHPGEVLVEELLQPIGLTFYAAAMDLHVPANRRGAIVKGARAVTPDTALRLARYFGTSAEFWLNLQTLHDLTRAKAELGKTIEREVRPRAA